MTGKIYKIHTCYKCSKQFKCSNNCSGSKYSKNCTCDECHGSDEELIKRCRIIINEKVVFTWVKY